MSPFRVCILSVVTALTAASCASSGGAENGEASESGIPDPLTVGLIPNVAPEEQKARYEPFRDYLAEELGVEVELFVATNYAGVVQAMASQELDLAYFGGITYLQADRHVPVTPLVTEVDEMTGTSRYISAIVVPADSDDETVEDIVADGGTFAMGDIASTSGSYAPRSMLVDAGADCDPADLESCPPLDIRFTGGHDAAAHAVARGDVVAGGLELRILRRLEEEGAVPEGELRVVAEREVEGYPWAAREELGERAHTAVTEAFLAIDDPELLDLMRAEEYTEVSEEDYESMRTEAEEFGLLDAAEERG